MMTLQGSEACCRNDGSVYISVPGASQPRGLPSLRNRTALNPLKETFLVFIICTILAMLGERTEDQTAPSCVTTDQRQGNFPKSAENLPTGLGFSLLPQKLILASLPHSSQQVINHSSSNCAVFLWWRCQASSPSSAS